MDWKTRTWKRAQTPLIVLFRAWCDLLHFWWSANSWINYKNSAGRVVWNGILGKESFLSSLVMSLVWWRYALLLIWQAGRKNEAEISSMAITETFCIPLVALYFPGAPLGAPRLRFWKKKMFKKRNHFPFNSAVFSVPTSPRRWQMSLESCGWCKMPQKMLEYASWCICTGRTFSSEPDYPRSSHGCASALQK